MSGASPSTGARLTAGTHLGPYEVIAPLGAGGMGQVYRGRDIRLDRSVAIKVLPPHLAEDPELRRRFEREARVISSLSHPNICTLFDIGRHEGVEFIVMELLEGETLAHRLERGPMPSEQVLKTGIEIADALEKAHKQGPGIVHRDLKPANIMLTKSGAKLLDFGLAKYTAAPAQQRAMSSLATADSSITDKGEIVGTFQYMAPEQLEGKDADARTDIFALGAVLYEMATGRPAFHGKTRASLIANIMNAEPVPLTTLQPLSPPALERVIKTCLAKDPDERWQTAHDVKLELKWVLEAGSQAGVPAPVTARRKLREKFAWIAAGVLALAAVLLAIGYIKRAPKLAEAIRFAIEPPSNQPFDYLVPMALSPDGRRLAFVAHDANQIPWLWLRSLDSDESVRLEGTEGISSWMAWSTDSRSLFFTAQNKIRRINIAGGAPETLCDFPGEKLFLSANQNDDLLFLNFVDPIQKISTVDCTIKAVAPWDRKRYDIGETWPMFLPDGQHFMYTAARSDKHHDIYSGSLDGKPGKLLLHNAGSPTFAAEHLFFEREGYLYAQPFDPVKLALRGEPLPVTHQQLAFLGIAGVANYSVAGNVLAYHQQLVATVQLSWRDFNGNRTENLLEPGWWDYLRISPNGQTVLASRGDALSHTGDLWVLDAAGKSAAKVTHENPVAGVSGIWSPDGKQIALGAIIDSPARALFIQASDGTRKPLPLPNPKNDYTPLDWSPDGKSLLYLEEDNAANINRLGIYPLVGNAQPYRLFEKQRGNLDDARFSPDGRWISYSSDESGRFEVFVVPFGRAGVPMQISTQGGWNARWMPDGKHILYVTRDEQLVSTAVQLDGSIRVGATRPLFQLPPRPLATDNAVFEIAPGGKRLLVAAATGRTTATITVLVNWQAELNKSTKPD
jgi:Tol biopolymer transport system component